MEGNYKIISQQKGKDIHSKVYLLKEQNTGKDLIVKIYENLRHKYYRKECYILDIINNAKNSFEYKKDFFVMYKEIEFHQQMFMIPDEVTGFNLQFLFFDYLPKFSLFDYISGEKQYIEEIHIKYICFELLMAIKNLHKIKVYPNNLDISNIMFDSNFQPKMIHFCEAEIVNNDDNKDINIKLNNDFFYLGKILAKLISFGKFKTINFNKKKNYFEIKANFQKNSLEETTFWNMLKNSGIGISEEFFNFFHILINAKESNEIVDIDNLFKSAWLYEISQKLGVCEKKFLYDFEKIYEKIISDRELENKIDIDLKDIIDINNNKNEHSIINEIVHSRNYSDYLSGVIEKENLEDDKCLNNNNQSLSINPMMNSKIPNSIQMNNSLNKMNMNNNWPMFNDINNNSIYQNNYNFNIPQNNIMNNINVPNNNNFNNINMIKNPNHLHNFKFNNQYNSNNSNFNQNIINYNNNNINILNNNFQKVQNSINYPLPNSYYKSNLSLNEFPYNRYLNNKKMSDFGHNISTFKKVKNESKPNKSDYNYLEINIKENNLNKNEDINKALKNFIKNYTKKLKENYSLSNIRIYLNNITDFSFDIEYDIYPLNIDIDELTFLDEKYEEKIKNLQRFKIKVELIKGDNNNLNNINRHQYYLIFNGFDVEQEDFYEQIKILKNLAKSLLIKN